MRESLSEDSVDGDGIDRSSNDLRPGAVGPGDVGDDGAHLGHECSRRDVLRGAGIATLAAGTGLSLAACLPPGIAVPSADVPVGGGTILAKGNYVVTQPAAGEYKAFGKSCPHAMCPVTAITNGEIICECHGSKFSIDDGSVITGPATKGLGSAKVTVTGDTLTVSA